ncbi:hypothetical protein GMMP15_370025 [Candidatus Magnetomoraceae bacterium gMMP-15]
MNIFLILINSSFFHREREKMPTTVLNNIKGNEIPLPWLKKAKETPDTTFKITLEVKTEIADGHRKTRNKWVDVLKDFRKKPFTKEASKTMQKASQAFREGFA